MEGKVEDENQSYDKTPQPISPIVQDQPPALKYSYSGFSDASSCDLYMYNQKSFYEEQDKFQKLQRVSFLLPQQLSETLVELTEPLRRQMQLSQHLVMYLLYSSQWKTENLNETYFDGQQEKIFKIKDDLLRYPPKEIVEGVCPICLFEETLIQSYLCSHSYCIGCWQGYITERLIQGEIFFPCMNKCEKCPILEPFVQSYFPALTELYKKKIGINYCLACNDITYCPSEKCEYFCKKPMTLSVKKVQCECGNIYCFYCRKEAHSPLNCEAATKWETYVNKQSNNNEWIINNTTVCPKCKSNVQKSIGCNYIKCVCGCQFCYACSQKWDQNHKGSHECPTENLSKSQKKKTERLKGAFQKSYEAVFKIKSNSKRDLQILDDTITCIKDENIQQKLREVKKELTEAWDLLKWGIVGQFIHNYEVDSTLVQDFKESIGSLLDSIKTIKKNHNKVSLKQLHVYGEDAMRKLETMVKCRDLYELAWEEANFS